MQKNTPNYTPNTHFGVLGCPGGAPGDQNIQRGSVGFFCTESKRSKHEKCLYIPNKQLPGG